MNCTYCRSVNFQRFYDMGQGCVHDVDKAIMQAPIKNATQS